MLAVVAAVVFLIGLIVRIVNTDFELEDPWLYLLLGLTLLAAYHFWPTTIRGRREL